MVTGAMSTLLERQTENTVIALQSVLDQRIADMSKSIQRVESRCAQDRAAVQACLDQSMQDRAAVQQCLDQNTDVHRLACTADNDIAGLRVQLQALAELVTHCIEDVGAVQKRCESQEACSSQEGRMEIREQEVRELIAEQLKPVQVLIDQHMTDVARCIDRAAEHWASTLDAERRVRADALETCAQNVVLLEKQLKDVRQSELVLGKTDSEWQQLEQQLKTLSQLESMPTSPEKGGPTKSVGTLQGMTDSDQVLALQRESVRQELLTGIAPQVEKWEAALQAQASNAGSRIGEVEAELVQSFQREHEEMVASMQHGVGQLQAVMAGIAQKQECVQSNVAEQAAFSNEMHLGLPKLEQRVDEVVNRLTGAESHWVKKLDEMQHVVAQLRAKLAANASQAPKQGDEEARDLERRFQEVGVRIDGMEDFCARRENSKQQECLSSLAVACQEASQYTEVEFAEVWRSIKKHEENFEASSNKDCEQMSTICKELESLGRQQQALSEVASSACISPETQIARIRSIVAEVTQPIKSDIDSRFEALCCPDKARGLGSGLSSPSDSRRADPEPEPEMIDLRRLEARQEESRQALEELQQQLLAVQQHGGEDGDSLKNQLLQDLGQAQLELDESLKSDLKAHLTTSTSSTEPLAVKDLVARLDVVSAEAAQCTDCQNMYGTELVDMCRVLRDMDHKVSELSQLRPWSVVSGGSALDALQQRPEAMMLPGVPSRVTTMPAATSGADQGVGVAAPTPWSMRFSS